MTKNRRKLLKKGMQQGMNLMIFSYPHYHRIPKGAKEYEYVETIAPPVTNRK